MTNRSATWWLAVLMVGVGAAACGSGGGSSSSTDAAPPDGDVDAEVAPAFRNAVDLDDDDLATTALKLLGAPVPGSATECNSCHGITRQRLSYWRSLSDTTFAGCLTDLAVTSTASARQMIDCMRTDPSNPQSDFSVDKAGMASAAARLPWFAYTFRKAYGADADAQLAAFTNLVAMPRGEGPDVPPRYTQSQFDIVAEYFARGLPQLTTHMPQDTAPDGCDPSVSSAMTAHIAALKTTGWRQLNQDAGLNMFGCQGATTPLQCLASEPKASTTTFGADWDVAGLGELRVLHVYDGYRSAYWTRSSPDGRFVGHGFGGSAGSTIVDLQRDDLIHVNNAEYDPAFFPDNTGWMFQGGSQGANDVNTCPMAVLTDITSDTQEITMDRSEARCSNLGAVAEYQHLGRALGGGDYFAVDSNNTQANDDGGHMQTFADPFADYGSQARAAFTAITFDGTQFKQFRRIQVAEPFEGDPVISPSTTLMMSRVEGPGSAQLGYVVRAVDAVRVEQPGGAYTYSITTPEIARICTAGGKPSFSYDERWVVYHHYIGNTSDADAIELGFTGASDPAWITPGGYADLGGANVYLVDLATGTTTRITNMAPGQYALFPHFRSDGWIYLQVRAPFDDDEYTVASPAALTLEQ